MLFWGFRVGTQLSVQCKILSSKTWVNIFWPQEVNHLSMTSSIVDAHIATCQSVHWDLTLTLMNELHGRRRAGHCTGLSPYNRSSGVVHTSPLAGCRLPVGLHVTLSRTQYRYSTRAMLRYFLLSILCIYAQICICIAVQIFIKYLLEISCKPVQVLRTKEEREMSR